jgi:hypothetical protein
LDSQAAYTPHAMSVLTSLSAARESFSIPAVARTPRGVNDADADVHGASSEDALRRVTEVDESTTSYNTAPPTPPPASRARKHSDDGEGLLCGSPPPAPRLKHHMRRGSEALNGSGERAAEYAHGPPISPRTLRRSDAETRSDWTPVSPRDARPAPAPASPTLYSRSMSGEDDERQSAQRRVPGGSAPYGGAPSARPDGELLPQPVLLTLSQGSQARSQPGSQLVTLALSPSPRHTPTRAAPERAATAEREVRLYRAHPATTEHPVHPAVSPRMASPRSPREMSPRKICVYRPFAASSAPHVTFEPPPVPSPEFIARVQRRMLTQ